MKLPRKKPAGDEVPNWRPDFRDTAALPDLKVVRTSFVLNFVCLTIATVVLGWSVFREYQAFSLRMEISEAEDAMADKSARNAELLKLNKEFHDSIQRFGEAEKFLDVRFAPSRLLMALSRSLPGNMEFSSVAYDGENVVLRGTIRGASETASTRVSAYLDTLRQDELIGALFPDVSLTNLLRNPTTQGLTFDIALKPGTTKSQPKRNS
jgi:Tfp pilus assembly protein PilN